MKVSRTESCMIMSSWIELMAQNEDCLSTIVPIMVNRVLLTISYKMRKERRPVAAPGCARIHFVGALGASEPQSHPHM